MVNVPYSPPVSSYAPLAWMGKKLTAPPLLMVTLPEPSTLREDCQEVVQPRPKMPCV